MTLHCYFIAASWGDAAIPEYFKMLAQRLVERGHRVVYITHGQQIRLNQGDFQVYSFPSPRPTQFQDFIFLHKLVSQYKPDCMIANFGAVNVMTTVGWLNQVPCRVNWYRTPQSAILTDALGEIALTHIKRLRKVPVYALTTHLIANSDFARLDACKEFHIPKHKTHVFFNAIKDPHVTIAKESLFDSLPPKLVCVGRFDPVKGQDILLNAMALLGHKSAILELIGKGKLEEQYQQQVKKLNLQDIIVFAGVLPHSEIFTRMAEALFTIVPSRSEAFGLVNIESMSVGTPVIASAVGGIPEIIRDGVDGFLVPPDDPEALAEKIKVLLTDHKLREEMGRNARQRFLDVFEQTQSIEQQVQWFEELVAKSKRI